MESLFAEMVFNELITSHEYSQKIWEENHVLYID